MPSAFSLTRLDAGVFVHALALIGGGRAWPVRQPGQQYLLGMK